MLSTVALTNDGIIECLTQYALGEPPFAGRRAGDRGRRGDQAGTAAAEHRRAGRQLAAGEH